MKTIAAWVVVTALAGLSCGQSDRGWLAPRPAPPIDGVEVTAHRPFHLADESGRVVLVSFGYTACHDVCPDTFSKAKAIFADAGPAGADLEFVYVSIDPERDRPEPFRAFLQKVDGRFQGVYLDPAALEPVLSAYGVSIRKRLPTAEGYAHRATDPAGLYGMDHEAGFWGIDRGGRLRFRFGTDATEAQVSTATRTLLAEAAPAAASHVSRPRLRVCADPNNLPFSNDRGDGFENKLAAMVAADQDEEVEYAWRPQRRGFLRETLDAKRCDVVMGVPAGLDRVRTTRPYYRSGYAFVYGRAASHVRSLSDPALAQMRIGVALVGDDGASTPPAVVLAKEGLGSNLRGFSIYGDYREDSPAEDLVRAVRDGAVDVAVAWGPMAGSFARSARPPLDVALVSDSEAAPGMPLYFDIAMGVRKADEPLARKLDAIIDRRRDDIARLLDEYGVPRVALGDAGPRL